MKTTLAAPKVWLAILAVVTIVGCAKKDNNQDGGRPGSGYGYGSYPGGTSVPPGGLVASTAGYVHIDQENLIVDFELYFRSTGGTQNQYSVTVDGQVRMNQSDYMCQITLPGPTVMSVVPQQSQVTFGGTSSFTTVSGRVAVQGPMGLFFLNLVDVRLVSRASSGPAIGRISGNQFPFYMEGMIAPGSCQNPSMHTNWSFDPL